jgi:hypothetical protein
MIGRSVEDIIRFGLDEYFLKKLAELEDLLINGDPTCKAMPLGILKVTK